MIDDFLENIESAIDKELEREVRDTHDYSSSSYNAFDDGFNQGVETATAEYRDRLLKSIKDCAECQRPSFHIENDYMCIICRHAKVQSPEPLDRP